MNVKWQAASLSSDAIASARILYILLSLRHMTWFRQSSTDKNLADLDKTSYGQYWYFWGVMQLFHKLSWGVLMYPCGRQLTRSNEWSAVSLSLVSTGSLFAVSGRIQTCKDCFQIDFIADVSIQFLGPLMIFDGIHDQLKRFVLIIYLSSRL